VRRGDRVGAGAGVLRAPLRVFGDGVDREDAEHRIADELQHLAAVRQDGAGHARHDLRIEPFCSSLLAG
jgi:hypothetical protein